MKFQDNNDIGLSIPDNLSLSRIASEHTDPEVGPPGNNRVYNLQKPSILSPVALPRVQFLFLSCDITDFWV